MQPNRSKRTCDLISLNGKHVASFVRRAPIGWRWSRNNPPFGPVAKGWTLRKSTALERVKETSNV